MSQGQGLPTPKAKGKGKAKATISTTDGQTERTPLLPSEGSRSRLAASRSRHPSRWTKTRSILFAVGLVLLSLLISLILFIALLLNSFKPSPAELDALPKTAFRYSGPEGVSILNITDEGVLVNITIGCGIDADQVLGFSHNAWRSEAEKEEAAARGWRGTGSEWWEGIRRWAGGMALGQLPTQAVQVVSPEPIFVHPHHEDQSALVIINITQPFEVPIVSGVSANASQVTVKKSDSDLNWLQPVHIIALVKPIASTGELFQYAQEAWAAGQIKFIVRLQKVQGRIPGEAWWSKYAKGEQKDIAVDVSLPVPRLPNVPLPGRGKPLDLASLVQLKSYGFNTTSALTISALASIPNILPGVNTTIPFSLPFSIWLPSTNDTAESKMAEVVTEPLRLGGNRTNLELAIHGVVEADLKSDDGNSDGDDGDDDGNGDEGRRPRTPSALSHFLQNYLHGKSNPIIVRGLSTIPHFAHILNSSPPNWLLSTLPTLSLPLSFPGPQPPPKIIESVTIERMRIAESGGKMIASGVVIAEIELPKGMAGVKLDVRGVKPDILVFDGPPDTDSDGDGDEANSDMYKYKLDLDDIAITEDGETYPPRAFGHIHPDSYLPATASPSPDPFHPHRLIVRSPFTDIPLDILPERDGVLRSFVAKVVFKGGAVAGIKGTAGVLVELGGIDGRVRLGGLPVQGEVWVGRQRGRRGLPGRNALEMG